MGMFDLLRSNTPTISAMQKRIKLLERTLADAFDAQASTDVLTNTETLQEKHYSGTPYVSYASQVGNLALKYDNKDYWGCMVARNIIDVRAAFAVGQGIVVKRKSGVTEKAASREIEFAKEFLASNRMTGEYSQEYAKEGEIEGRALFRLQLTGVTGASKVRAIHVPWRKFSYTVKHDETESDYNRFVSAEWNDAAAGKHYMLTEPEFVYKRFGGTTYSYTEPVPKTAQVLRHMEDMDKAIWDLRKINHIHASPTPVFTTTDVAYAKDMQTYLDDKNWRIGKAIVVAQGGMTMEGWGGESSTAITNEIEALVKVISGSTGVPVHFLGFPELLSNRNTADNLIELIVLSTNKERQTWELLYNELVEKAMALVNADLDMGNIELKLPFITKAKMVEVQTVWLPMYNAGAISLSTLLNQLSGEIDPRDEVTEITKDLVLRKKFKETQMTGADTANNTSTDRDKGNQGGSNA